MFVERRYYMVDFTACKEQFNIYKGSEKKKTLIYNGKKYLVKFPDPIRQKNKNISYINNAFSEYIGSNIFRLCRMKVQNTILGIYHYDGKDKIVCACEDFTDLENILYEFENLALSANPNKKIDTEISDIMKVLEENCNLIDLKDTKDKFWNTFIVDSLIGNTDRHNGNWGFLLNEENNKVEFSPIYDCGSCLHPMLEDEEVKNLTDAEQKNIILNTYSCLKENGKKINYMSYIKGQRNSACNEALKRVFPNIQIEEIHTFIENIEYLSEERKEFYKRIISERYKILKEVYENLKSNRSNN